MRNGKVTVCATARSALSVQSPERPRDDSGAAASTRGLILRRRGSGAVHLDRAELVRLDEIVHVTRLHLLPLRAVEPDVDAAALRISGALDDLTVAAGLRDTYPRRRTKNVAEVLRVSLLDLIAVHEPALAHALAALEPDVIERAFALGIH